MSSFLTSSANCLRHAYTIKFDWQARHKHKINASQGIENFFILLTQFCVAPGSRLLFRFFFPVEIRLILLVQAQIPHFHMLYSSSPSHTLFKSSSHLCQGSYSRPSRNLAFGTASRHFWSFWGRASFISSSTLINKTLLSNYGLLPLCKKALAWKYVNKYSSYLRRRMVNFTLHKWIDKIAQAHHF